MVGSEGTIGGGSGGGSGGDGGRENQALTKADNNPKLYAKA